MLDNGLIEHMSILEIINPFYSLQQDERDASLALWVRHNGVYRGVKVREGVFEIFEHANYC
jgi:hypothetical protein